MRNGFSKDSPETKFVEGLPLIGYIAAPIHAAAGHHDHAKRAAAKCTTANLTLIGGLAGLPGGPLGVMAGAAAGSAVGSEHGISKHIKQREVRDQVGDVSPHRFLIEGALAAAAGGAGSAGSHIVKGLATEAGIHGVKKALIGQAGSQVVQTVFGRVPMAVVKAAK